MSNVSFESAANVNPGPCMKEVWAGGRVPNDPKAYAEQAGYHSLIDMLTFGGASQREIDAVTVGYNDFVDGRFDNPYAYGTMEYDSYCFGHGW